MPISPCNQDTRNQDTRKGHPYYARRAVSSIVGMPLAGILVARRQGVVYVNNLFLLLVLLLHHLHYLVMTILLHTRVRPTIQRHMTQRTDRTPTRDQ